MRCFFDKFPSHKAPSISYFLCHRYFIEVLNCSHLAKTKPVYSLNFSDVLLYFCEYLKKYVYALVTKTLMNSEEITEEVFSIFSF